MNQLLPAQTIQFVRRFRFQGAVLLRFRIRNHSRTQSSGEVLVRVTEIDTGKRVRLRIAIRDVEEYRFQRRPGPGLTRLKEVRLAVFDGCFYLNLDAFADDGMPALHEFRASDAFIAGRSFSWEIVAPTNSR